ncbi:MAG: PAS domain S-box protein [Elusimicrobia bacterium]|nr:PAS domain S-box protein [Elusimicrobiota bacterium]
MKKPSRRPPGRKTKEAAGLSAAVAHAPVMLFELDSRGRITLLAGGLAEELRLKPAAAVGRSVLELHMGIPRAAELIREALAGRIFCAAIQIRGRTLEMCFSPRRGPGGRVRGVTGWAADVTGRKQAEATLRDSEERFRHAFELAPIGMALVAVDGRWLRANPALCAMLGYGEEELCRTTFQELTHPDDLPKNLAEARRLLAGEIPFMRAEKRYRHKDGHYVWAHLNTSVVRSPEGEPLHYISQIEDVSERKRVEEALREKSAFMTSLVQSMREGLCVIDKSGRRVMTNAAFAEMTGYSEAELLGQEPPFPIWPPEHRARIEESFAKMLRGELAETELIFMRKNGKRFPVVLSPACRRGERGEILDFIVTMKDISDRKLAEESLETAHLLLKKSLRFTEALLSAIPTPVFYKDPEGRYLGCNRAFSDLMGVASEDLEGKTVYELWPGEDARIYHEKDLELLRHPARQVYEFKVRDKDGRDRPVIYAKDVFRDENDRVAGIVGAFLDITERKQAEEARRLSLSQLQATLESTADGTLVVDREGKVTNFNQRFLRIWSIPSELAATRDDDRLLAYVLDQLTQPEEFLAKVRELYSQPERESFDILEFKDGRVIERYSQPQLLEGRVVGRVWSFRDVTTRVRAEAERSRLLENERAARAEAEIANKAKDDFLAIVSHELRTPLTAIMGWSWLLRSGKLAEEERQNALDIIQRNMQSQRQIVEDLIDISSLSRGQFNMTRSGLELGPILESVCRSLEQIAGVRGIRFALDLQSQVGIKGDAGRLQQVFWNLLHNAMKFSPDDEEIGVSLRRDEGLAVVEVRDKGKGIPAHFIPHLFEPFRQGEDPLIREHRGLGLGLAIVKRLVELHDGRVSAESAGEGSGAVFTVRLPATAWPPEGEEGAASSQAQPASHTLAGLDILVVEDEADARQLLVQVLSRCGARVRSAADAQAAMASLDQAAEPDLLLFDIALPGEDGCTLLRRVRDRGGKLRSVPAAALTAMAQEEDRLRALEAGFQLYLTKPAEPAQIVEALRVLAGRH